jgi:hypothetical protein
MSQGSPSRQKRRFGADGCCRRWSVANTLASRLRGAGRKPIVTGELCDHPGLHCWIRPIAEACCARFGGVESAVFSCTEKFRGTAGGFRFGAGDPRVEGLRDPEALGDGLSAIAIAPICGGGPTPAREAAAIVAAGLLARYVP